MKRKRMGERRIPTKNINAVAEHNRPFRNGASRTVSRRHHTRSTLDVIQAVMSAPRACDFAFISPFVRAENQTSSRLQQFDNLRFLRRGAVTVTLHHIPLLVDNKLTRKVPSHIGGITRLFLQKLPHWRRAASVGLHLGHHRASKSKLFVDKFLNLARRDFLPAELIRRKA